MTTIYLLPTDILTLVRDLTRRTVMGYLTQEAANHEFSRALKGREKECATITNLEEPTS